PRLGLLWRAGMDIRREVLALAEQLIEPSDEPLDESLFTAFRDEFGFELHDDLKEWLRLYNGGWTRSERYELLGLSDTERFDMRDAMRIWLEPSADWEIPDFKGMRWAPIAYNDEGDLYWLQCQPDEHNLTPVYFLNHDEATYCVVGSDLWHFLWLLCQSEQEDRSYHWMFDRDFVLQHDPRLKAYEGKELLAWEFYGPEGFGSAEE
ncbi:MAG: SMI1/KNR4 family protein, partial [Fimbriimonadales bacterium]|nr:SMI1/KNR4 family protein [Fimbriimonadales bacterium]